MLPAVPKQHGDVKHLESPLGKFLLVLRSCSSAQTANMLLGRLSPGDACARLEGELDPIVAVRE